MKETDKQIKRLREKEHTKAVLISFLKRQTSKDREKDNRKTKADWKRQKDRNEKELEFERESTYI